MFKFKTNAMAALVLGLGLLTACSSNDELGNGTDTAPNGSTYMSVAINLSTGSGTRADADNQKDTEESDKPDYNFVGKWAGKDKIKQSKFMSLMQVTSSKPMRNLLLVSSKFRVLPLTTL